MQTAEKKWYPYMLRHEPVPVDSVQDVCAVQMECCVGARCCDSVSAQLRGM